MLIVRTVTLELDPTDEAATAADYAHLIEPLPEPEGWNRVRCDRRQSPGGKMLLVQTVDEKGWREVDAVTKHHDAVTPTRIV